MVPTDRLIKKLKKKIFFYRGYLYCLAKLKAILYFSEQTSHTKKSQKKNLFIQLCGPIWKEWASKVNICKTRNVFVFYPFNSSKWEPKCVHYFCSILAFWSQPFESNRLSFEYTEGEITKNSSYKVRPLPCKDESWKEDSK